MDYRFYQNSADVISILARVDMQRYAEVHRCCYPLKLPPRCIIQLWSRIEADVCRRLSPQCTSMFFAFWWKKPHKSYFHGTIGKLDISDIVLFKHWGEFRGLEVKCYRLVISFDHGLLHNSFISLSNTFDQD